MKIPNPNSLTVLTVAVVVALGALVLHTWLQYDCTQKQCPPGLTPYRATYSSKCLCVKEAE